MALLLLPATPLARRNLSGESARNAAPNSSLKLLRVLLQVKLGARLVNSVHQQRLLSFELSKCSYEIFINHINRCRLDF